MVDLTPAETVLSLAAVFMGAVIQGSIGFGLALVLVPALALLRPEALPMTVLLLAFPMTLLMALRERRAIDIPGFVWITGGRLVGTVGGIGLLVAVPAGSLSVLFGALIVVGAALSGFALEFELRRSTRFVAGVGSGIMGTAAGIGGPALALVYQRRPGPVLRSTLALSFVVGTVLSLSALAATGRVEAWHGLLALELLPALLLGLWVSRRAARWLDERWLRPTVLTFAGVAGIAAVVQGLLG